MSQNVSIMFLFIGAFITALGLIDDFKKDKGFTIKKAIYIVAFIAFLSIGTWDTCNRYKDSSKDQSEVLYTVKNGDSVNRKKTDSSTNLLHKGLNENNGLIKSIPKKTASNISQNNKEGKNEINQNLGTNNGNIGGDGNKSHIVQGTGNSVGVNGDVNIDTQPKMNAQNLSELYSRVQQEQEKFGIVGKNICLQILPSSNGQKVLIQIRELLESKGYTVRPGSPFMNGFKGILINHLEKECVLIIIGELQ